MLCTIIISAATEILMNHQVMVLICHETIKLLKQFVIKAPSTLTRFNKSFKGQFCKLFVIKNTVEFLSLIFSKLTLLTVLKRKIKSKLLLNNKAQVPITQNLTFKCFLCLMVRKSCFSLKNTKN